MLDLDGKTYYQCPICDRPLGVEDYEPNPTNDLEGYDVCMQCDCCGWETLHLGFADLGTAYDRAADDIKRDMRIPA